MTTTFSKKLSYLRKQYSRRLVRDCVDGSDSIKRASTMYLPIPTGMLVDTTSPNFVSVINGNLYDKKDLLSLDQLPFYHPNPAYMSYLQAARFPDIVRHTLHGLVGTATRIPPEIKIPSSIDHLIENATNDGLNIFELFSYIVSEILQVGNVALVVDIDPVNNLPYIAVYSAETNINWAIDKEIIGPKMSVFYSKDFVDGDTEFEQEEIDTYLAYCYRKEEENSQELSVCQISIKDDVEVSVFPNLQGKKFDRIPVVYIGTIANNPEPQTAPLIGIADIAISIYRKNADVNQAQHLTCNPNLVISGIQSSSGVPHLVGSTVALILEEADAQAYYPTTDSSGISVVKESIVELFEEAMLYGASLVGPSKKGVESVEVVKSRQSAMGATMIDIVRNAAKGLEEALEICASISGSTTDEVEFIANTDFSDKSLSPEMISALSGLWMAQGYSLLSLLQKLKDAGLITSVEEELQRIETEGLNRDSDDSDDSDDSENDEEEGEE